MPPITKQKKDKVEGVSCQHCGHSNMHVRVKWEGKPFRVYEDKSGRPHSYATALKTLSSINDEIEAKTFEPKQWLPEAFQAKKFENAMASWIDRKERETEQGKLAPSTLGNYKTYNRMFFNYFHGLDVAELKMKHLQLFYDALGEKDTPEKEPLTAGWTDVDRKREERRRGTTYPLSPKYRKNVMDALYTFFRWLKRWGEIKELPTWPELETVVQHEPFTLVEDAQVNVLSRIPIEHRDIIQFLMETGMRPSEVCALMAKDIDPQLRKALIRRTYSEATLRERTKQKKERWVVLTDLTWELVMRNAGRSEFVFTNQETGRGYKYKFIYRLWKKCSGTQVGFYNGTRHSLGTQLGNAGVPIQDIQKILGHADMRSTQRYVHTSDERTRQLLSRRGKVIDIEEAKKK
jgi:integrase